MPFWGVDTRLSISLAAYKVCKFPKHIYFNDKSCNLQLVKNLIFLKIWKLLLQTKDSTSLDFTVDAWHALNTYSLVNETWAEIACIRCHDVARPLTINIIENGVDLRLVFVVPKIFKKGIRWSSQQMRYWNSVICCGSNTNKISSCEFSYGVDQIIYLYHFIIIIQYWTWCTVFSMLLC